MKKKVFELSFDEVTQKFSIKSEFNPAAGFSMENLSDAKRIDRIIDELVKTIFEQNLNDSSASQIIRCLTIANISADAQPYQHIEELWSTMVFSFLPRKEKGYRKMKEERGIVADVIEPVTGGFDSFIGDTYIKS